MAEAISVEQFLKSATLQYSEYADGRSLPLNLGSKTHATIQVKCGRRLMDYLDKRTDGYVASGLHCILKIDGQTRLRRPDLAVVLGDPEEDESPYLERAPDLVVEVRSPEDAVSYLFDKVAEYFENGTKLVWIILPEEDSVLVCRPGVHPVARGAGETLDGGDLLPGLAIAVDDVLGV